MGEASSHPVMLDDETRQRLAERQATCPFVGSLVAEGVLPVCNGADAPLARLEDIRTLGNSGGGDLGDLLVLFAAGNHACMDDGNGQLARPVPTGLFFLGFPGSQGAHPGHSGILMGDPATPGSGRFDAEAFARLAALARDGWIRRTDIGHFIAANLHRDPAAKVLDSHVVRLLASDLLDLAESAGSRLWQSLFGNAGEQEAAHRRMEEKLTRLLGEDNLVGAAGEFGLLFAFLANQPGRREIDGEPAVDLDDLLAMFRDKRLPEGWRNWKKTRGDWVIHTTALLLSAAREYLGLQHARRRGG
ncbi:MAG: hypothetical protein JSR69_03360 [Proteobacteria bacterium]|nr:hypothetical protein [Pseudomonadota bacterium]